MYCPKLKSDLFDPGSLRVNAFYESWSIPLAFLFSKLSLLVMMIADYKLNEGKGNLLKNSQGSLPSASLCKSSFYCHSYLILF